MEYKKVLQYQGLIAALLILFLFIVPSPIYITGIILWFIIFIVCNQVTYNILFSIFIASAFIAIFAVFRSYGIRGKYNPPNVFRDMFIENFEDNNNDLLVDNPKEDEKKEEKISMMDELDKDDEDAFGKLDAGDYEDSDEDTDADEDTDNMEIGKSETSSKKAYKAQKQLYDLTLATKKLGEQMEKLSAPLKKGQKIIDSLQKFGINKFV